MKAILICPAVRPAVPQLSHDLPLALTPILGECVVSHWIEHLAQLGARQIHVIAADRADQVRAALGDGARWGVQLEVTAVPFEPTVAEAARFRPHDELDWLPAPHEIVVLNHLPGCAELPLFESYASWFAALLAWAPRALTPARMRVSEIRPGIWVGRRAHVSPDAELIAPCWIGDQAFVEPGAIVGPGVILEDRSVVADDARVSLSWIGPDTFVGPMTSIASSLAWGSSLTNWRSESSLEVPDPFLLCSLARSLTAPTEPFERPVPASARAAGSSLKWITAWSAAHPRTQDSNPPA